MNNKFLILLFAVTFCFLYQDRIIEIETYICSRVLEKRPLVYTLYQGETFKSTSNTFGVSSPDTLVMYYENSEFTLPC